MSTLLQASWLGQLGWVLVHTLWQGALLWALLAIVFAVGRHRLSAARRHQLAWLALSALAFAPVLTFLWMQIQRKPPAHPVATFAPALPLPGNASDKTASPSPAEEPESSWQNPARPTTMMISSPQVDWAKQIPVALASAWLAGIAVLMLRLLIGWSWISRLRRHGAEPEPAWEERFLQWMDKASLRAARVVLSPTLGVPLVIGWFRPAICFPAALLTRLSLAEVEALFLHELAHLKRRDPLLHLWVTVVETLHFHNPAAHALARTVRDTSELACDDLVLAWQGDGKTYARALAAAEEWRSTQFALAASGGSLKARIQRIRGLPQDGRRTALAQRFGLTSVAGIALYLMVFGLGVPQLARALTPEERLAVINKQRQALNVGSDDAVPRPLEAVGTVRFADGSTLASDFTMATWCKNYTSYASGARPGRELTVHGRGDSMTVGAWIPGYAPAFTEVTPRDPQTGRGSFALTVERGFPAILKFVDDEGRPVPDAIVSCTAYLTPDCDMLYQGKLTTEASGTCSPGNAREGMSFRIDVRAFGFQWQRFQEVHFRKDAPTTLRLAKAASLVGTVLDARTQKPIAGVNGMCVQRMRSDLSFNHGYQYTLAARMNATPSDAAGHLQFDICHPDDTYHIILEAPGYGRKAVELTGQSGSFRYLMEPELVFSGVVEDPGKKLDRSGGKVRLELDNEIGAGGRTVEQSQEFAVDAQGRIPFTFRQVSAGKITLRTYFGKSWESVLDASVENLAFRMDGADLKMITGTEASRKTADTPVRRIEVMFQPPLGSPPFSGRVAASNGSSIKFHKVENNLMTVDAPVGKTFRVYQSGVTGYRFQSKSVKVSEGAEPLSLEVPMEAAGAISGEIALAPGMPVSTRLQTSLVLMQRNEEDGSWENVYNEAGELIRVLDQGARYFISPVPLDAAYRIIAYRGTSYTETPTFRLTAAAPLSRQALAFSTSSPVRGTVLQPDGAPMPGGSVSLMYKESNHRSSSSVPVKLDGTFEIPGVNFTMTGEFYLAVASSHGIAPLLQPLDTSPGQVTLQRVTGHTVTGVVLGPDGSPLQGVKLNFIPADTRNPLGYLRDHQQADAPTDASGRFQISTLLPGAYRAMPTSEYTWLGGDRSLSINDAEHTVQAPSPAGKVYQFRMEKR